MINKLLWLLKFRSWNHRCTFWIAYNTYSKFFLQFLKVRALVCLVVFSDASRSDGISLESKI